MTTWLKLNPATAAVFRVDACPSWTSSWKAMVLLKRMIRQRASALRLFSTALLSCRYSPGPEERLERKRVRFPLRTHSRKVSRIVLGTIPQPDDQNECRRLMHI